jgi:hypothetical protein
MLTSLPQARVAGVWKSFITQDKPLLLLSIVLQLTLGFLFGHFYDIRIYMATGYLVGSGQNPYVAQDLTALFHNNSFQGMTSVGYLPPWPLVLGLLYRSVYIFIPNLHVYNLAIKIPVIVANVCLAYLVADILKNLGTTTTTCRRAWVFLLFNPFLLYTTAAWGQFDSIVALFSLLGLVLLAAGKIYKSAILLALAISLKPIALPILLVALVYVIKKSPRQAICYSSVFSTGVLLLCVVPFILFRWDPTPILRNWRAHFSVGGGMSFLAFFELITNSYQLPGNWWLLGMLWIPALGIGVFTLTRGISGFEDLLKKSTGLVLIFFLTRAWLSEPNIVLILPLVLILTSIGELDNHALLAVWTIPLIFSIFNTSLPQLLFPTFPNFMEYLLSQADHFRAARIIAKSACVIPWQIAGWWIVSTCLKSDPSKRLVSWK